MAGPYPTSGKSEFLRIGTKALMFVKDSPSEFNIQSGMRTTDLGHWFCFVVCFCFWCLIFTLLLKKKLTYKKVDKLQMCILINFF